MNESLIWLFINISMVLVSLVIVGLAFRFAKNNNQTIFEYVKDLTDTFLKDFDEDKVKIKKEITLFVNVLKRINGVLYYYIDDYCRRNRTRTRFNELLESEIVNLLRDGYAFDLFPICVDVVNTEIPSYISVVFHTKTKLDTDKANELLIHLRTKVEQFLSLYGMYFPLFPIWYVQETKAEYRIYYCEYPDEIFNFIMFKENYIRSKTQNCGILDEDKLSLYTSDNNEILLGVSGEKWQENGYIKPMFWKSDVPHLMIAGTTGGGKSVLAQNVAKQLMVRNADIVICDFKAGGDWDNILPASRYAVFDECDKLFNEFYSSFCDAIKHKRQDERFLIFDEVSSFLLSKKGKELEEAMKKISHIAFMGRSFGYHLIFVGQQFSTKVIDSAVREQFGIKIHMGSRISTESATMMFPNCEIDKSEILPKYCGYIVTPESGLMKLQTAYLKNPMELKRELQELGKKYL